MKAGLYDPTHQLVQEKGPEGLRALYEESKVDFYRIAARLIPQVRMMLNQELNRRHAHRYRTSAGRCVVLDIDANIRSLRRRVDRLEAEGVALILSTAELA